MFERFEDNGAANIATVHVIIENETNIGMLGGQAACAYLLVGTYSVYLEWTNPYASTQKHSAVSKLINVQVEKATVVAFEICRPKRRIAEWMLRSRDDRPAVKCDTEQ